MFHLGIESNIECSYILFAFVSYEFFQKVLSLDLVQRVQFNVDNSLNLNDFSEKMLLSNANKVESDLIRVSDFNMFVMKMS